jgi:hypothetical protein
VFKLEPVQEEFFDEAPFRLQDTFAVARPAAEVWGELTSDHPLSWCRLLGPIMWTSPRPFGVGTTRTVRTRPPFSVFHERFFRWEEGRRKSFYVLESRMPGIKRFGEDYLVEPTGDSSCTFTWTIAAEQHPAFRAGEPGNRLLLGTLFRDTRRHYGP